MFELLLQSETCCTTHKLAELNIHTVNKLPINMIIYFLYLLRSRFCFERCSQPKINLTVTVISITIANKFSIHQLLRYCQNSFVSINTVLKRQMIILYRSGTKQIIKPVKVQVNSLVKQAVICQNVIQFIFFRITLRSDLQKNK